MRKRKKINMFKLIFMVLFLFFAFRIVQQEIKIYQINQQINATKSNITELEKRHEALKEEQKMVNDPKYIEKVAREDYNMVKTMEIPVTVK